MTMLDAILQETEPSHVRMYTIGPLNPHGYYNAQADWYLEGVCLITVTASKKTAFGAANEALVRLREAIDSHMLGAPVLCFGNETTVKYPK